MKENYREFKLSMIKMTLTINIKIWPNKRINMQNKFQGFKKNSVGSSYKIKIKQNNIIIDFEAS